MIDQITPEERAEYVRDGIPRRFRTRAINADLALMVSAYEAALTQAEARIRELEEALRPFAVAADAADRKAAEHVRLSMGSLSDNASTGLGITFGQCRRASAALSQEKK